MLADSFIILSGIPSGPVSFLGFRRLISIFSSSFLPSGKLYFLGLKYFYSNLINTWISFIIAKYRMKQSNVICLILELLNACGDCFQVILTIFI